MSDNKMLSPIIIRLTVYTGLFVALIAVGAFISIPITPIPIVLQNMFVLLAGLILGPIWGVSCVAIYLFIGLAGFPVFAGGTSGIGKFLGPTGGYLLGYLPAVYFVGLISRITTPSFWRDIIAMILGSVIIYCMGVVWLKIILSISWIQAVFTGIIPFLLGDILKIIAAGFIARNIRKMIKF